VRPVGQPNAGRGGRFAGERFRAVPPPEKGTDHRCTTVLSPAACLFQHLGYGTAGVCANYGGGLGVFRSFDGCIALDKNGVFLTGNRLGGQTPRENEYLDGWGVGLGAGVAFQVSNGTEKDSLRDKFKAAQGGGSTQVGAAWGPDYAGRDTVVVDAGPSIGLPAGGAGGESYTAVSGYVFEWCGLGICNLFSSRR